MKVYVDEMPKDCLDCPCESEYYCNLLNEDVGYLKYKEIHENCPLKLLNDYERQIKNELYEKIKSEVKKLIDKDFSLCNHEYANGYCYALQYDLVKILNKILEE